MQKEASKQSSAEIIKAEKDQLWTTAKQKVDATVDKRGVPIDEEIKDTVTALQILKFPTSNSCAGHTVKDEGYGSPLVEISALPQKGWQEDNEKKRLWAEENLKQKKRLTPLLEEFYQGRNVPPDVRLHFSLVGVYGSFDIESVGVKTLKQLSEQEIVEKIRASQKEMTDFGQFLKNKFFGE